MSGQPSSASGKRSRESVHDESQRSVGRRTDSSVDSPFTPTLRVGVDSKYSSDVVVLEEGQFGDDFNFDDSSTAKYTMTIIDVKQDFLTDSLIPIYGHLASFCVDYSTYRERIHRAFVVFLKADYEAALLLPCPLGIPVTDASYDPTVSQDISYRVLLSSITVRGLTLARLRDALAPYNINVSSATINEKGRCTTIYLERCADWLALLKLVHFAVPDGASGLFPAIHLRVVHSFAHTNDPLWLKLCIRGLPSRTSVETLRKMLISKRGVNPEVVSLHAQRSSNMLDNYRFILTCTEAVKLRLNNAEFSVKNRVVTINTNMPKKKTPAAPAPPPPAPNNGDRA